MQRNFKIPLFNRCYNSNPTSNDVYFILHDGSRRRHVLHLTVLHLTPHVPGDVIHL